jgi:flagellin
LFLPSFFSQYDHFFWPFAAARLLLPPAWLLVHDGAQRRTAKYCGHIRRKQMALTVATNSGALMAQAAASSTNKSMEVSMERLATGKRINSASDDAAGVAIASRLTSEIRGTNQAIRNAMDGQAMLDTAEGAHVEIENILQRMRELAVQAGNDTNAATDRTNISSEISQLTNEIDRIAATTTWAGQSLLDGTGSFNFQVGSRTTADDTILTTISSMSSAGLSMNTLSARSAAKVADGTSVLAAADAGTITVANALGAQVADADNQVFSSGIQSYSVTGGIGVTLTQANNLLTLDLGTTGANGVVTVTINGQTFSATNAATNDTSRATAAGAIMDQVIVALGDVTGAAGTAIAQDATSVGDGSSVLTVSRTNVTSDLVAKLNADTSYSSAFTATRSSTDIVSTAKVLKPTISVSSVAENGAGTDPTFTLADNALTVATVSSTATATNNHDLTITIDGTETSFNTFTHGENLGFNMTAKDEIAAAIKNRITDTGGFSGGNMVLDGTDKITFTKGGSLDVSTTANAKLAVDAIDAAITAVNTQRATLGSVSNRLDSTVSNLTNISANLQAGRGRIEDADFAAETTALAKSQILQQASTAMLAQANASKQGVLSLLQG